MRTSSILSKSVAVVTTLLLISAVNAGERSAEHGCDEHKPSDTSAEHDREPYEDYGCVFVSGRWSPPMCNDYLM